MAGRVTRPATAYGRVAPHDDRDGDRGLAARPGRRGDRAPGGTLYPHLERVQQQVARLGASEVPQRVARTHAAYGTDGFDVRLLEPDDRPVLVALIGAEAEELVHRYGACDRDRTWDSLAATGLVWDRSTGDGERLDGDRLREFADLSIVNELDVAEQSPAYLDRHGAYFRRLTTSWEPLLSPAVAADARRVLG